MALFRKLFDRNDAYRDQLVKAREGSAAISWRCALTASIGKSCHPAERSS
jgi:hypothetical protein